MCGGVFPKAKHGPKTNSRKNTDGSQSFFPLVIHVQTGFFHMVQRTLNSEHIHILFKRVSVFALSTFTERLGGGGGGGGGGGEGFKYRRSLRIHGTSL